MIHIMQFLLQTQSILNNMIYDLTLWFNHIMAQTKITNIRIWKFHKIIIFHDDEKNLISQFSLKIKWKKKNYLFNNVMHKK
jgi:hypothetical protein